MNEIVKKIKTVFEEKRAEKALIQITGSACNIVSVTCLKEALGTDNVTGVIFKNEFPAVNNLKKDALNFLDIKSIDINLREAENVFLLQLVSATNQVLQKNTTKDIQFQMENTFVNALARLLKKTLPCNDLNTVSSCYLTNPSIANEQYSPLCEATPVKLDNLIQKLNIPKHFPRVELERFVAIDQNGAVTKILF